MAGEARSQTDPIDLRAQLANLLRLMECAGQREIFLPGGPEALLAAARSLAPGAGGAGAGRAGAAGAAPCGPPSLSGLLDQVGGCRRCELHKARTNTVFGEGNPRAKLMFIGEGPGADEDAQGRPFVGRAGQLLTRIIEAMGLRREDVYIGNIVKCRPPANRVPEPDEIASCLPYLEKQIEAISPEIICTLGNVATQTITGERRPISDMRGRTFTWRATKVVPTYHPAACLRNPSCKKLVWEDVQVVMKYLGLPVQGVRRNGAGSNRD
jgi:uracil-DNA glycosylase family 4